MLIEIVAVVLLAVLNGFFALSEMALMTSRPSRLKSLAHEGRRVHAALALTQQPEQFLATVQVFITLLGIGTGAALGARIGGHIAAALQGLDLAWLSPYSAPVGVALSVSGITFANMLLGELLPKRMALVDPERIAIAVALPMRVLAIIASPFAFVLIGVTRAILRALRLNRASREQVSEEEIRLLVSEGAEQGVIDRDERNMVNRVLRLGDRTVDSLMTPRPRIAWLDIVAPLADNLEVMRATPYSRYPVIRGSEQDVVGVLEIRSVIDALGRPQVDLFKRLGKPLYVPATARALDLLEEFRDSNSTLAMVVDEYGEIEGLVTLNDVLGAVLGKTPAPIEERRDAPIVQREDGSYLIDGALGTEDLRELLGIGQLPAEEDHDFRTAAGMVMAHFGRIPATGEFFRWRGFRFEVVDLDGPRIDKLLVQRVPEEAPSPEEAGG
ncbi:MAG TPA: hemolysin family protein [Rhodanobacteraceae bacterium]|nr:hemolysin family protein [Rhodanobacteraceae bacterium]